MNAEEAMNIGPVVDALAFLAVSESSMQNR
jgi:hypothetical protein